jgi:hypothetical protein
MIWFGSGVVEECVRRMVSKLDVDSMLGLRRNITSC